MVEVEGGSLPGVLDRLRRERLVLPVDEAEKGGGTRDQGIFGPYARVRETYGRIDQNVRQTTEPRGDGTAQR